MEKKKKTFTHRASKKENHPSSLFCLIIACSAMEVTGPSFQQILSVNEEKKSVLIPKSQGQASVVPLLSLGRNHNRKNENQDHSKFGRASTVSHKTLRHPLQIGYVMSPNTNREGAALFFQ
ncbi:hypothetical protein AVEN_192063-1 [Araneus ventricosus]|uniref:Uncharacterized protein n=1 Tax=Araneus ventricosus TaxID=182803 RepID=A0A4Y2B906_ARAVE|nr:hypothetical protein AVEN_192063-1 [Araneus ventricosus]